MVVQLRIWLGRLRDFQWLDLFGRWKVFFCLYFAMYFQKVKAKWIDRIQLEKIQNINVHYF
jgi:hypothetical protein